MPELTTLRNVKRFYNDLSKDNDPLLTSLIEGSTSAIEEFLKRTIVQATATNERLTVGIPSFTSHTRSYPIISVSVITEGGTTLVADTDYELDEVGKVSGQLVRIGGSGGEPIAWSTVPRTIKITYVHGFATVPAAIALAAEAMVIYDFNASNPSDKSRLGLRSISMATGEDITFLTRSEMWENQMTRINSFRRVAA